MELCFLLASGFKDFFVASNLTNVEPKVLKHCFQITSVYSMYSFTSLASWSRATSFRSYSLQKIGSRLLYLTTTRPDMNFAVQQLSQFIFNPMVSHHEAALRVLRYIKKSLASGLFFSAYSTILLALLIQTGLVSLIQGNLQQVIVFS